jgi:putative acetyltransferase
MLEIVKDDLGDGLIIRLLEEHRQEMLKHSPPENVHALDTAALRAPNLTFWRATVDGELAGCGALKEIDHSHGEIKSMKTRSGFLRKGVAKAVLESILREAERRAYHRVSLETGSMQAFKPARTLYENFGFTECEPFADYFEDPHSVCMTKVL